MTPLVRRYIDAVRAKDVDGVCGLYAARPVIFDAWMKWKYANAADWRKNIEQWFEMIPAGETVRVVFDEIVEVKAGLSATITYASVDSSGKTLRSLQNRLTWLIEDGKIVHEHTSAPLDFETGKGILKA